METIYGDRREGSQMEMVDGNGAWKLSMEIVDRRRRGERVVYTICITSAVRVIAHPPTHVVTERP